MNHRWDDPFFQFEAGLGSVATIFVIEFGIFVFDSVNKIYSNTVQSLPPTATTNHLLMNFSTFIGFFILLGLAQNLIVGLIAPKPYTLGFLVGDGVILYILYIWVLDIIPSVFIGMAMSFLVVLACFIIRLHFEKPNY